MIMLRLFQRLALGLCLLGSSTVGASLSSSPVDFDLEFRMEDSAGALWIFRRTDEGLGALETRRPQGDLRKQVLASADPLKIYDDLRRIFLGLKPEAAPTECRGDTLQVRWGGYTSERELRLCLARFEDRARWAQALRVLDLAQGGRLKSPKSFQK